MDAVDDNNTFMGQSSPEGASTWGMPTVGMMSPSGHQITVELMTVDHDVGTTDVDDIADVMGV